MVHTKHHTPIQPTTARIQPIHVARMRAMPQIAREGRKVVRRSPSSPSRFFFVGSAAFSTAPSAPHAAMSARSLIVEARFLAPTAMRMHTPMAYLRIFTTVFIFPFSFLSLLAEYDAFRNVQRPFPIAHFPTRRFPFLSLHAVPFRGIFDSLSYFRKLSIDVADSSVYRLHGGVEVFLHPLSERRARLLRLLFRTVEEVFILSPHLRSIREGFANDIHVLR